MSKVDPRAVRVIIIQISILESDYTWDDQKGHFQFEIIMNVLTL